MVSAPPAVDVPRTAPTLRITFVANAGVLLTDGETTLLVDLPYRPSAFGYADYDPDALRPAGRVVSVITHGHDDHFDPALWLTHRGWSLIGPPSVTAAAPRERTLSGDSLVVGRFSVVAVPSTHAPDHRSYRVRWADRVVFLSGDTEDPEVLARQPALDVLYLTPWLSCAEGVPARLPGSRVLAYHLSPDGSDVLCGGVEPAVTGDTISLPDHTNMAGATNERP